MADTTPDAAKDAAKTAAKIPAGILNILTNTGEKTADALNAVAKGGLNFGGVLANAGGDLKKFGDISGLAGSGLKIFGEYAQESVDAMRNFSKVGAGFSGDAIGMRASIAQTNMSLEQYGKFLNSNSALLNGMGGTVSQGAKAFNLFSKEFFEATGKTNKEFGTLGDQLRNLGMTSEEINGVLALELTSRRFTSMQDAASKEAALQSAAALAEEMDKTAKLTGKSREEQQKSLAALERDGKYQAAIRIEMMNGNKFAAEGMISAMSKIEKFGPGVQNLTKDIVSYGTASKDTAATLSALGPAGTQLQNAINMTKTARTEEQKAAAAKAVSDAEMAIQVRLSSKDFNEMSKVGIKGAQDVANQTTTLTAGLEKVAAENKLNLNIESDRIKANQIRDAEIKKQQTDAKTPAKPGEADQGKATTQMVVQFESSLQKASAAINENFIKRLNDEIAPAMAKAAYDMQNMPARSYADQTTSAYNALKDMFKKETAPTPQQSVQNENAVRAAREEAIRKERASPDYQKAPQTDKAARERVAADEAEKKERARIEKERPATTNPMAPARGADRGTPVYVEPVNGQLPTPIPNATPVKKETRSGGSLEMAGKMFEDWGKGTMVELHGLESVMRPQDLSKVIESAMGGVRKTMPKIEMPNIDLSKLSQSITTSLSSVTGGKETTVRGDIPGYQSAEPEADIDQLTQLKNSLLEQTSSIAEQTQSMLAVKKDYLDTELIQIGEQLSALSDEKVIQTMRENSIQDGIDKLKTEKDIYENNQKYDERDLTESTEELAMLRNRIDNSESAEEVLELQKQVDIEEALNLSLQRKIAERNQNILNTNADIALKEQELLDLREEMADTEIDIQDTRDQLLDSLVSFNEDEKETAMPGAMPATGKDPFARMLDKFMGPMAEPGNALAPAEAAKTSVTAQSDAAAKQAAAAKAKTNQSGTAADKDSSAPKTAEGSKEATLSDVVKSLDTLNKQVGLLNGEMSKLPNLMEKAVSATKSLNGNLNARVT